MSTAAFGRGAAVSTRLRPGAMSAHGLTTFIYQTFGQQFGDVVLAGYGAKRGGGRRKLYLTESGGGADTGWVLELVSNQPPCREEPLVLAGLLKLLLRRPNISQYLEFELDELLTTLQWQDAARTRRQVDTAIGRYVRLLYDKSLDARAERRSSALAEGGYYHLLTGYVREPTSGTGEAPIKTLSGVYFDSHFIRGLRQGQVYFADIDFGPLKQPG